MNFIVETPRGSHIPFKLNPEDSIKHLKYLIEDKLGIDVAIQQLSFEGLSLEDDLTLAHYNFQNNIANPAIVFLSKNTQLSLPLDVEVNSFQLLFDFNKSQLFIMFIHPGHRSFGVYQKQKAFM